MILGAGLAGLSAGYHLAEPFEIFEANHEIGGVAGSISIHGFIFDHAIHVLYTKDPYASHLIRSLLGDNFVEHRRSAWIYSSKYYTPYPYQTNMFGLPAPIIRENLRGLYRSQVLPKYPIRNFEEWVLTTFGEGIARNFMLPFNRKLWATDLTQMGFQWIADRVPQPDISQIIAGALRPSEEPFGPNATFWYPRTDGTAALPKSFVPYLPPIRTAMPCMRIDLRHRKAFFQNGESFLFERAISTIPLPVLIRLLDGVPTHISRLASQLKANRVWTINLGIARENISRMHWIYFPEPQYTFHRISFPMNFSETLVPKGTSSIMVEISESATKPIEHRGLVDRTIAQLQKIGILRKSDTVICSHVTRIDPAYIVYSLDHEERVQTIQEYLLSQGIISCGRFGEWQYLNMDQAILSGKRAAEQAEDKCPIRSEDPLRSANTFLSK
jgi:protoporphyrinogen oxidase